MVSFNFRGIIAAPFAPFNSNLTLNTNIVPAYAQYLINSGIKGVLVNGTTGEGMSLNVAERKQLTEAWSQAVKTTKQHLMVQVGGAPLPDVLELAKHAENLKVDSLLCLPELYFKPNTTKDLIRYLKRVGEAAPNTPLLYYHSPNVTNVNIHMGEFLNEIKQQLPTFCGIKFASDNMDEALSALKADNSRFTIFFASRTLLITGYALGFHSANLSTPNVFPQLNIKILESVQQSKINEARDYQNKLSKACEIIAKHGNWLPSLKAAMNLLTPINVGPVREPLFNLTDEQISEMEKSFKTLKI